MIQYVFNTIYIIIFSWQIILFKVTHLKSNWRKYFLISQFINICMLILYHCSICFSIPTILTQEHQINQWGEFGAGLPAGPANGRSADCLEQQSLFLQLHLGFYSDAEMTHFSFVYLKTCRMQMMRTTLSSNITRKCIASIWMNISSFHHKSKNMHITSVWRFT